MKYGYTREHMLPIAMEVTLEDLRILQKMTKHLLEKEELPDDMYKGDIRKVDREITETLKRIDEAMAYAFPKSTE